MHNEWQSRIERLHEKLVASDVDAALVTSDENVFYFSGFTGDSTELLITVNGNYLFTDFRYTEQATSETTEFKVIETKGFDRLARINDVITKQNIDTLGVEKNKVSIALFENLQQDLSVSTYFDVTGDIAKLRAIKSRDELEIMQKAAKISDATFLALIKQIKPGITESDIEAELTYLFNKAGCGLSFKPIIASGEHSSLPHAPVTQRKIQSGDLLTIDFGCKLRKYCTDCTRTIGIGMLAKEQEKVYDIVKLAQQTALDAVRPGITCESLDGIARNIIKDAGYGGYFGHGLGHGVGLDIHEFPRVGGGDQTILEPGMVITIEPGIYLKNQFGVRIEDMCYVTQDGFKSFNLLDKALTII